MSESHQSNWTNVTDCRICHTETNLVANLGPLALTAVFPGEGEEAPRIPVTVRHCPKCGLLQLGENTRNDLMYKPGYGYKSGVNESMVKHLNSIVKYAAANMYTDSRNVLDIGYNDGTLLNLWNDFLSDDEDIKNLHLFGYDPIGWPVEGATTYKDFFHWDPAVDRKYDVITSIAMFYDLPDPVKFACDIYDSLTDNGIWILEVGYAGTVYEGKWDGLIHEHLEYYGLTQILHIADLASLRIHDFSFNDTNGGSLQVILEKNIPYEPHNPGIYSVIEAESKWDWSDLQKTIELSAKNIRHVINGYRTYVLGASSKGNAVLQMMWATPEMIPAAIERNPDKFGRRTPGTNIPIQSEEWLRENPPQMLLVLPYHFKEGILERYKDLREKGVKFVFPLPEVEVI